MLQVQPIQTLDLPELQPYRTMRRQHDHRVAGIFVAEGEKVVRRLLESRFGVLSVLLPEKWLLKLKPLLEARADSLQVFVAEKRLLETLTGFSMYQGLLAVGKVPDPIPMDVLLRDSPSPRLWVAVDGLSSAENLGAVVRNCAAFGAQALLVGETSSSPYLRRAVRSSMGTVFELPLVETPSLLAAIGKLQGQGVRCLAAHPHADGKSIPEANLANDVCIVLGSEGDGISPAILEACDDAAAIPMPPTVDSLNVGSAAAVFLYEANRQRGRMQALK